MSWTKQKKLIGAITAEDAVLAVKDHKTIGDIVIRDAPTVPPDIHLNECFELISSAKIPVTVVDEKGRLLGIIVRGAVLAAIAGTHDTIDKKVNP